ncbi:MAG: P1 family peptidase [Thaumarchaeota archaeon]|nr:P1 family peptidase [Nitrososphaerota archaeon]
MENTTVTRIPGVRVGQAVSRAELTGCTVLLLDAPGTTAFDARGGWPGTFDTESVGLTKTYYRKQAIFLTGGDVFGLKCAFGIQKFLLERRLASARAEGRLPGVVGANIYDMDLARGVEKVDYEALGYQACASAISDPVREGNEGAGLGATVGKLKGVGHAMKGGVGSSVVRLADGTLVGALIVTNAVGNVFDGRGTTIAGTRRRGNRGPFFEVEELAANPPTEGHTSRTKATTIGAVVTNLELSHEATAKVAEMAHDGLARCIRPVHTPTDGDALFCVSTGEVKARKIDHEKLALVGHMASVVVQESVIRAVLAARSLAGVPSVRGR